MHFSLVAEDGFEPPTLKVWTSCSSQLSYSAIMVDLKRLELSTPWMQIRCSPNWAIDPLREFFSKTRIQDYIYLFFFRQHVSSLFNNGHKWSSWYNNFAVAMVNYEPGQDRNVAALSNLVMCDGFCKMKNIKERYISNKK